MRIDIFPLWFDKPKNIAMIPQFGIIRKISSSIIFPAGSCSITESSTNSYENIANIKILLINNYYNIIS